MNSFKRFLAINLIISILGTACTPLLYAGIAQEGSSESDPQVDLCKGTMEVPIDKEQLEALLTDPDIQHEYFEDAEGNKYLKFFVRAGQYLLVPVVLVSGLTCLAGAGACAAGAVMLVFHEAWDLGPKIFLSTTFGGAGVAVLAACVCFGATGLIQALNEWRLGQTNEAIE